MFRSKLSVILHVLLGLSSLQCSPLKAPYLDGFIVGGDVVQIEDYPHQASILWMGNSFCGGFIVNSRWIVTAAHCVAGLSVDALSIRAGSSYRDRGGQVFNVISNVHHSDFHWFTLDYDVALLRVDRDFDLNGDLPTRAINLVGRDQPPIPDGTLLRVSGFGATLVQSDDESLLRAVSVPKISNERCKELYAEYPFPVNDNMLCAGFEKGGRDACQGDSGSALVDDQGRAVGIVSWGIGCAQPGYPGVYARISSVAKFIEDVIKHL